MSRARRILIRITAVFIGIIFSLLIGEVVVRLLYKDKIVLFPRFHAAATYGEFHTRKLRPNTEFTHTSVDGTFHFKINNKGFRNDYNVRYEKPADSVRIFCVGDSHTEGFEVDQHQTFSYVCEQLLNKSGMKAEVFDAGVSGSGTAEEMVLIENELVKYKPDAVVLGLYANDFQDNLKDGLYKLKDDSLINSGKTYQPGISIQEKINNIALFRWLSENSYLYSFAFNTIYNMAKRNMIKKNVQAAESENAGKEVDVEEHAVATNHPTEYQMNLDIKLMEHIYSFCKAHNIRFVIVDIPRCNPFDSTIPAEYVSQFRSACDTLFYSLDMKNEYSKLPMTHVPHGQFHISAYSHQLIGTKLSQYFLTTLNKN